MTSRLNTRAARAVALHARDIADARLLLDVLGLVEGGRIAPDDVRVYKLAMVEAKQETGEPNITKRAKGCNTPAGLANLTPIADQPKTKARKRAKATVAEGRPSRAKKAPRVARCGTASGYTMHQKRKEEPCQACRDARNAYQRRLYARRKQGAVGRPPAACGTRAGYDRHRYRGEEACDPCRAASAARQRAYYAQRAAAEGRSVRARGALREAS